jgi:hypothetical protein
VLEHPVALLRGEVLSGESQDQPYLVPANVPWRAPATCPIPRPSGAGSPTNGICAFFPVKGHDESLVESLDCEVVANLA